VPTKVIALNRKAYHDYHVLESVEAGIMLSGPEIKSVRSGAVNLRDSYVRIERGEAWLYNVHIARYNPANRYNLEPTRPRKLLLHKREIQELAREVQSKGLTLVPLKLYLKDDLAKVEVGLVRGKRQYDKREAEAKREAERDIARAMRREPTDARRAG
jgi:SsrA-binding protein